MACAAVGLFASRAADAQSADREGGWRRSERPPESEQRFAIELRFGPYRPNIDEEFPDRRPYERAFGADRKPFYFGLEFDWQLLRIPKVGTLGPYRARLGLAWVIAPLVAGIIILVAGYLALVR